MVDSVSDGPAQGINADAEASKAPDPRRHYASPEDLRDDINLDIEARHDLLKEWQQDLDRRLESEAEGMSAQDPMSQERESRLANEARRVSLLITDIAADCEKKKFGSTQL